MSSKLFSTPDRNSFVESPPSRPLDLYIVFTNLSDTCAVLHAAAELARDLQARITVLVPQAVPYPLPLSRPPVPIGLTEQSLEPLTREPQTDTSIRVLLCRDRDEAVRQALPPESLVVIGERRHWWSRGSRLARILKRDGHRVLRGVAA